MIRGWFTAGVSAMVIGTYGLGVLLVGLIYPSRRFFARASSFWARTVLRAAGLRLLSTGSERVLDGSARLLVGNHQSSMDIPILLAACRGNVRFMASQGGRVMETDGQTPALSLAVYGLTQPGAPLGSWRAAISPI